MLIYKTKYIFIFNWPFTSSSSSPVIGTGKLYSLISGQQIQGDREEPTSPFRNSPLIHPSRSPPQSNYWYSFLFFFLFQIPVISLSQLLDQTDSSYYFSFSTTKPTFVLSCLIFRITSFLCLTPFTRTFDQPFLVSPSYFKINLILLPGRTSPVFQFLLIRSVPTPPHLFLKWPLFLQFLCSQRL